MTEQPYVAVWLYPGECIYPLSKVDSDWVDAALKFLTATEKDEND